MKIKIGFTKPRSGFVPYSWAIRFLDNTPYSHVYVEWYSENIDCRMIYEAAGSMIHFTSPIIFDKHNELVKQYEVEISSLTKQKFIKNCVMRTGIPYAALEAIGIGIVKIARFFGINLKTNPFGSGSLKSKCSELVFDVLNEVLNEKDKEELNSIITETPDMITPKHIDQFLGKCKSASLIYG